MSNGMVDGFVFGCAVELAGYGQTVAIADSAWFLGCCWQVFDWQRTAADWMDVPIQGWS